MAEKQRPSKASAIDPGWTGPSAVETAERIVVETPVAHSRLIAALRAEAEAEAHPDA